MRNISLVNLKKPSLSDRFYLAGLRVGHIQQDFLGRDPIFSNAEFQRCNDMVLPNYNKPPVANYSLQTTIQIPIKGVSTSFNINCPGYNFPISINDYLKRVTSSFTGLQVHAIIIDLQFLTRDTKIIKTKHVEHFIKKIKKKAALIPMIFIISTNAQSQFISEIEDIATQMKNVYLVYTSPKVIEYSSAIELAAILSFRPYQQIHIQKFYRELGVKSIPKSITIREIIEHATQPDVDPKYRSLALSNFWINEKNEIRPTAQKLIDEEQDYYDWQKKTQEESPPALVGTVIL